MKVKISVLSLLFSILLTVPAFSAHALTTASISTGSTFYTRGDTVTISVGMDNTGQVAVVDAYAALILPGGGALFMQYDIATGTVNFVPGDVANPSSWTPLTTDFVLGIGVSIINFPLFQYTFASGEPPGPYALYMVLTTPGTTRPVSNLASAAFYYGALSSGGDFMGLALDAGTGQPVANALFGLGSNFTGSVLTSDPNGAVFGRSSPGTGWIQVHADGYAETYTKSLGSLNGVEMGEARLIPVGDAVQHDIGMTGSLTHTGVSASLPPSLFGASGVHVSLTSINPPQLDAGYALFSGSNQFRQFVSTFTITAEDASRNAVPLAAGQAMPVTITLPGNYTTPPPLAFFDPAVGNWQIVPGACTLTDPTHMQCNLPHLSTYGVAGGASPATLPNPTPTSYEQALANGRYALEVMADAQANGGNTAAAQALIDQSAAQIEQQATQYAQQHPDMSGIQRLLEAEAINQLMGRTTVNDLIGQSLNILEQMAQALLNKPGCGHPVELVNMAARLELLGSGSGRSELLIDKLRNSLTQCDLWYGTVRYMLTNKGALLPGVFPYFAGAKHWYETHNLQINIDPNTGPVFVVNGQDAAATEGSAVKYREPDNTGCAPQWVQSSIYLTPDPGNVINTFDGTYTQAGGFQFNPGVRLTGSLNWHHDVWQHIIMNPATCVPTDLRFPGTPLPYPTYLETGGAEKGCTPVVTLTDMFAAGGRSTLPNGMGVIRNYTKQSCTHLPVNNALVTWSFVHVNNVNAVP